MAFATGSKLGADVNNASSTAQFTPGDRTSGTQDTMWVYIEAGAALATGKLCILTTGFTATPAHTSAGQAAANQFIAFPQTSFTSGQFGWACYHGNNVYVQVSGTTNASAVLYLATISGVLHSTSASSTLAGVILLANTSATATNQAVLANLTWPRFGATTMPPA